MEIAHSKIESGKTFVIAELSANHNQNYDIAVESIKAIAQTGADAVKLQTYTADTMTLDIQSEDFLTQPGGLWEGRTLYDLYRQCYTPWEWHPKLMELASRLGLVCFSSPFDKTAVDFLCELNVPAFKIASFEIQDLPLIEYAASKGKPMLLSTGIAAVQDIQNAIDACNKQNNPDIVLLKCTSSYPAPVDETNLVTIPNMMQTFNVPVGISDHTLSSAVSIAAVALGACVVEKHFILDKRANAPDAPFSLDFDEMKNLVKDIRDVERALGRITYNLTEKTMRNKGYGRSLYCVKNIKAGEILTEDNIRSIRPGYGLEPKYLAVFIGKRAKNDIEAGTALSFDLLL